jgi:hypothetical protein
MMLVVLQVPLEESVFPTIGRSMINGCAQVPILEDASIESCGDNGRFSSKELSIVMGSPS